MSSIDNILKKLRESREYISKEIQKEFPNDAEAKEWAEENGYKITKIQQGRGEKACICWMRKMNESAESSDIMEEIRSQVLEKVINYLRSEGFTAREAKDYSRVDVEKTEDGWRIEVGAEVSYDGLMDLCDLLNPIVSSVSKDSYFEPVDSGIIEAWINSVVEESKKINEESGNERYQEFVKKCTENATWKKMNGICEKYGYQLSPTSHVEVMKSGKKLPSINIKADRSKEYLPEIYYMSKFGSETPTIEIQTTSYGALSLEKHKEYLEALTSAQNMMSEISKIDYTELYNEEVDY